MKRNTLLIALVLGLIMAGSVLAAGSKPAGNATESSKISGTIVSSSSSELVVSSVLKGKTERETFVVNAQTKTSGTPAAGEKVTVRYKNENGEKIATMISVRKSLIAKGK